MPIDAKVLDVTCTRLVPAPPARVMQAFFADADLRSWEGALREMQAYMERESLRTKN